MTLTITLLAICTLALGVLIGFIWGVRRGFHQGMMMTMHGFASKSLIVKETSPREEMEKEAG